MASVTLSEVREEVGLQESEYSDDELQRDVDDAVLLVEQHVEPYVLLTLDQYDRVAFYVACALVTNPQAAPEGFGRISSVTRGDKQVSVEPPASSHGGSSYWQRAMLLSDGYIEMDRDERNQASWGFEVL